MPNCRHSSDIDASPHSQAMQNRAFSFTEQVSNHAIARTSKLERSLQTCYLSSRSILLPIIPVWTPHVLSPEGRGTAYSACMLLSKSAAMVRTRSARFGVSCGRNAGRSGGDLCPCGAAADVGAQGH